MMQRRSPLEDFVASLVDSFVALGEAEEACSLAPKLVGPRAQERLAFCREQSGVRLEELVRVVFSGQTALQNVRALLSHHAFRISRSEQGEESTRQRMRELSSLLKKLVDASSRSQDTECGTHLLAPKSRSCSSCTVQKGEGHIVKHERDERIVSGILGLSYPEVSRRGHTADESSNNYNQLQVLKRAMLEPRAIHARASMDENRLYADGVEDVAQSKVREVALCIMSSKDTARTMRKYFEIWRKRVNRVSVVCVKVAYAMRARRTKLLSQAFGRLGRHTAFQNGIILAQKQGAGSLRLENENFNKLNQGRSLHYDGNGSRPPWDIVSRPEYRNSRPNLVGRKMPWER